ncbi:hypothetical protein Hanom_Chr09g00761511 [Helianthus anomalus]
MKLQHILLSHETTTYIIITVYLNSIFGSKNYSWIKNAIRGLKTQSQNGSLHDKKVYNILVLIFIFQNEL